MRRYNPRRLFLILKSKSYDVESSSYLDRREWLVLRFYVGTNSYFSTFFTFLRQTTCDGSFFVRKQFLGNKFSTFNHKIEIEIPDVTQVQILFLSCYFQIYSIHSFLIDFVLFQKVYRQLLRIDLKSLTSVRILYVSQESQLRLERVQCPKYKKYI